MAYRAPWKHSLSEKIRHALDEVANGSTVNLLHPYLESSTAHIHRVQNETRSRTERS